MKYLKLFENQTDCQSFIESDGFVTPNVLFVKEENLLHFNAAPEAPQHDFVIWITDTSLPDNSFEDALQAFNTRYPNPYEAYLYKVGVYEADAVDYTSDSEVFNPSKSPKNKGYVYVKFSNPEAGRVSGLLPYEISHREFSDEEQGLYYSFYECLIDGWNIILYTETDNINWQVGSCEPW